MNGVYVWILLLLWFGYLTLACVFCGWWWLVACCFSLWVCGFVLVDFNVWFGFDFAIGLMGLQCFAFVICLCEL